MSAHISDELPQLLTGDASRDVVLTAAAHLRTCPDCQQELVSAVVAHASLTAAHRFAPDVVTRGGDQREDGAAPPAVPLPDLSPVFMKAREDAATRRRGVSRGGVAAAAAVAAVVVAGGVVAGVLASSGSGGATARTVALRPVGSSHAAATATLIGTDRMRIDATALPALDTRHQYEVWLTSANGATRQAVGFIGSDRRADISIPTSVMLSYNDIAVSIQRTDQTRFSGKTVLLGSYT